ncbi:hypothetical protein WJX79_009094 [Trebouxia sp. C0005]
MLLERLIVNAIGCPTPVPSEAHQADLEQTQLQFESSGNLWPDPGESLQELKVGHAVLTSHRLLWTDKSASPNQGSSCQLPLSSVHEVQLKASMMLRSPKIRVFVYVDEHSKPADKSSSVRIEQLKLVAPHMTPFVDAMRIALTQKAWERQQPAETSGRTHTTPSSTQAPGSMLYFPSKGSSDAIDETLVDSQLVSVLVAMGFSKERAAKAALETGNTGPEQAVHWLSEHEDDTIRDQAIPGQIAKSSPAPALKPHGAGVAGILRREAQLAAQNDESLEQAFKDLSGLMAKAAEMVELAERFRTTMAAQKKAAQQEGEPAQPTDPDAQQWMDSEMQAELVHMGIASPVTKAETGARYHQELARQLGQFLGPQVDKAGVPLRIKEFSTGVLVVQSQSHSTEQVCARIGQLVAADEGLGPAVTASDVASALAVPLPIASEHLLTAESRGGLCRDDGPEGLRFFRNFFLDIPVAV